MDKSNTKSFIDYREIKDSTTFGLYFLGIVS